MATKTVKKLAEAIYQADIGMNADSEDYLRLAKQLRPHLTKFFGEEIVDDTDPEEGDLWAAITTVDHYRIPMPARDSEEAMKVARERITELMANDQLKQYLVRSNIDMDKASFDWESNEH